MNILIITGSLSGGGTERVSAILADYLHENGHNVIIAVLHSHQETYPINRNIKVHILPSHRTKQKKIIQKLHCSIMDYFSLKNIIAQNKIEKIISFCMLHVILTLILTKQIDIILSKRNYPLAVSPLKFFLEKQIFKHAKTIIFQTSEQMECYEDKIRKKGIIIHNPLFSNLPAPYNGVRRKEIITFCRIIKQKNLFMLVDGFIKFYENSPEYKLTIYGNCAPQDKSYKDGLEKHISAKNMEHVIKFRDFTHNIHSLVIDTACFVLTSDFEGISNSMLEAMAIGLPVICTDCKGGGAREFIKNYKNGILVPTNDINALTQALLFVSENPEKAQAMGKKAAEIKNLLSHEKICAEWVKIL